jgi:hypothetical protein
VFRACIVLWERKGEQARDLLRGGLFGEKKAEVTFQAASRFLGSWEEVRRVYGVAQERVITDQVRRGSERSSTNDCQMWPIAGVERGPVTISTLTRNLSMPLKS